jgi:phosphopantothenoylcysteine decarboxylase/phosphopantothenate--cysteine ligase
MNRFNNKNILLGITGGIAAYKSAELVRRLREQGAQVRVVMTAAAREFITPLTLQALSGQVVYTNIMDAKTAMAHIELARWAEVVLIAPATADFMAKLAYGHANDLLSTLCLATTAPIIIAPAMNQQMWQARATQENYKLLQQHGVKIFGPAVGAQACGETGAGRMLEPVELVNSLTTLLGKNENGGGKQEGQLQDKKILITAGPTREHIDPVRFISNRSSGRMGYAVAEAAIAQGADVTLISGPVSLSPPQEAEIISVDSSQDMFEAVMAAISSADIFIATAAVADYRPSQQAAHKLKKNEAHLTLSLEPTPDILARVANLPNPPFTVGFAAETKDLIKYAQSKLKRKKLNMIAANIVGIEGIGFDSEENALQVFWNDGDIELSRCSKKELAHQLMDIIIQRYRLDK